MSLRQPRRLGQTTLLLAVTSLLLGLPWWYVTGWGRGSGSVVLFTVAAAIAELLPFERPRGRAVPMSVAVIGAFALLEQAPHVLALVAGAGWVLGAAVRRFRGGQNQPADALSRVAGAWALGGCTALTHAVSPVEVPGLGLPALPAVAVVLGIVLGVPLWEAMEETARARVPVRPVFLGLVESGWRANVALSASAVLGALVHPVLGVGAVPMILLPLLAARVGLARHALVRRTYDETVRAMSRLPEELGAVPRGHGVRVGILAVEVARELGLRQRDVEAIERAAHLHEVGRVRIDEPDPSEREMALAGAGVVREAGSLDDVAGMIEQHRSPYRLPRQGDDPTVPIGSRVVRSACDYDRCVHDDAGDRTPWDGLERLRHGMASDHDPEIVQALTRVLDRRGVL